MDKNGGLVKTNTKSVKIIKDLCTQFDMVAAWRVLNLDTRRCTWGRIRPQIQCQLDFFLVTQSVMCNVKSTIQLDIKQITPLIEIMIATHSNTRGPSFWKPNTSFLTETDYVNHIRAVIKDTYEDYQYDSTVNDALMWEMINLKIREQSLKYSSIKKSKNVLA